LEFTFVSIGGEGVFVPDYQGVGARLDLSVGGNVTVTAVPEPSTLILFGVGFLGLVGYVYRRKRC
jgi:hypothetical protein